MEIFCDELIIKTRTGKFYEKEKRGKGEGRERKRRVKNIPIKILRSNHTLCTNLKTCIRFIIIPPSTDKILCEKLARGTRCNQLRNTHFSERNEVVSARCKKCIKNYCFYRGVQSTAKRWFEGNETKLHSRSRGS